MPEYDDETAQIADEKSSLVTEVSVDESEEELVARAKASPRVQQFLDGKEIRQTIVVPGKLVNIVV